jgi:hypothetical protein
MLSQCFWFSNHFDYRGVYKTFANLDWVLYIIIVTTVKNRLSVVNGDFMLKGPIENVLLLPTMLLDSHILVLMVQTCNVLPFFKQCFLFINMYVFFLFQNAI